MINHFYNSRILDGQKLTFGQSSPLNSCYFDPCTNTNTNRIYHILKSTSEEHLKKIKLKKLKVNEKGKHLRKYKQDFESCLSERKKDLTTKMS